MLPIPFSNPQTYAGHSGVDFPQARGTVYKASGHGFVRNLGRNERGGYYIWVKYDGMPAVGYHHMDSHAGCPRPGAEVWEGTPLGKVGNSGHSTGSHLHSEVEGNATTSGYWRFFNRSRVVGSGSGASSGGGTPAPSPSTPAPSTPSWEDDMPTLITSAGGQSLGIEGSIVPLISAEEVQSIVITPGRLECSQSVHGRINATVGSRTIDDLIVNVIGGNGTRYVWAGGKLTELGDQKTIDQLVGMGARAVDWPLVEVQRLLAQS